MAGRRLVLSLDLREHLKDQKTLILKLWLNIKRKEKHGDFGSV
jgi:hypothetical protein